VRRSARPLAVCAASALLAACAGWPGLPARVPACGGALLPTGAMGRDFVLRQQVRVRSADTEVGFTLVSEKRGRRLVLVALDRYGAKAFTLWQEDRRVVVEYPPHPGFPVPPENVLRDLHRVRFLGEGEADPEGRWHVAPPGCHHETTFVTLSEEPLPAGGPGPGETGVPGAEESP